MASPRKPSRTARKIARILLLLDTDPRLRRVLPEEFVATGEAILRGSGACRAFEINMMRQPQMLRFAHGVERWLGRGQMLWFGVRKRWLGERVHEALADGASQVLLVGAGFDPLGTMLARRHPHVRCVEIDAPPTADAKRRGVEQAGLSSPNLAIVSADLAQRALADVLQTTGWQRDARSIVVAEGLLMYLSPADVRAFFQAIVATTGPGSQFAFSSVDADEQGRPRIGVLDRPMRFALRLAGEPMLWGIRPVELSAFIAELGGRLVLQPTLESLRRSILDPLDLHDEPLAPYEHLALAELSKAPA